MIEYVVTGMVLREPLTGYDIKKEIESGIGNFYKSSYGNLYPALKRLTDKGYLALTEQTHVERLKKYYMATELGKAAFLEWLATPLDLNATSLTVSMLTKIFFFGELPEDTRNRQLQEYESYAERVLNEYNKMQEQFKELVDNGNAKYYFELSTLFYGLQSTQGMINWLKYIREQKPLSEFRGNYNVPI